MSRMLYASLLGIFLIVNFAKGQECGGTVSGDTGSVSYPAEGELIQPGDICVWTIHLATQRDFRFNFSRFDVKSNNFSDCRLGGVRVYSLTNLAPTVQGYTFCDYPPSDNFFLGETVAAVVLFAGSGNQDPGSGFTLDFSGVSYDSLRTKHFVSISQKPEDKIVFPYAEDPPAYQINTAATWLIDTNYIRMDIKLNTLQLELCGHPSDPCACDALILYRISIVGVISEVERFCTSDAADELFEDVGSRWILAFFSDMLTQSLTGLGFDIDYYPNPDQPSTTTSGPITTTPSHVGSDKCGDILQLAGTQTGSISYKPGVQYLPNERCVWIVRFRNAEGLLFNLDIGTDETIHGKDALIISQFTRADPPLLRTEFLRESQSIIINGSLAVITFYSDEASEGTGFNLDFEVTNFTRPNISIFSRDEIYSSHEGNLAHPSNGEYYEHTELSMFLMAVPDFVLDAVPWNNHVTWTLGGFPSDCRDYVVVYKFYFDAAWSQYDLYCASSPRTTSHTDLMLYVFMSDSTNNGTGFTLEWYMD